MLNIILLSGAGEEDLHEWLPWSCREVFPRGLDSCRKCQRPGAGDFRDPRGAG